MMTEKMTDEILETVADHLGLDLDELDPQSAGLQTCDGIAAQWREKVRDLTHLDRETRQNVLRNHAAVAPFIVDGCEVRLYAEVQASKGDQRKDVAIVDLGDERIVVTGF